MQCIACGSKVGSGGDRHKGAKIDEPGIGCSVPGKHGDRKHSLLPARKGTGAEVTLSFNARGASVAGTGKPSASSDQTKKKKVAKATPTPNQSGAEIKLTSGPDDSDPVQDSNVPAPTQPKKASGEPAKPSAVAPRSVPVVNPTMFPDVPEGYSEPDAEADDIVESVVPDSPPPKFKVHY